MGHGGARPGAGRKKGVTAEITKAKASIASRVLASVDEVALWKRLLNSENDKVAFSALSYLTDQRDGRPKQALEHMGEGGGPVVFAVQRIGA